MRQWAIVIAAMTVTGITTGLAVSQKPISEPEAPPPKGYERFFRELSTLARKHPEAAKRFHIVDGKRASSATPQPKSSHHACCEWTLNRPRKCVKQCLE